MDARELTRDEKKKIRTLVTGMCANYDRESGLCLPLDCACYMLHKCWTGAYCRYFREAVLPLNPELQAALTTEGISPELRACAVCGKAFLPEGRQAYCSDACKAEGNRRKSRERMRKLREKRPGGCYDLPPPKAVSYTHLDVYKRQAQPRPKRPQDNLGPCWPEAIKEVYQNGLCASTKRPFQNQDKAGLQDVYKRQ